MRYVSDTGTLEGPPSRRRRDERGDTLVEVLVAIVILGIGAVALLAGFASAINGSSVHKSLTDSSNIVKSVANEITASLQSTPSSFTCPAPALPSVSVPTGYTISSSSVTYWSEDTTTQQWSWSSTCAAGAPQMVSITLQNTATGSLNTSSFVVVDPTAPVSPTAGAAAKVAFLVQPGGAQRGQTFLTQPVVAIEDSSGNIVTNDLSPLQLSSPDGSLSGCVGQETSGVVSYTGCQFSSVGTFTLTASDGSLQSASASVAVAKSPSAISVTSNAPSQEIAGQAGTYAPVATSTSGDTVVISTSSSLICSVNAGVVSFSSVGICVVDFNDPGNSNYAPAPQVTQEIPVVNLNSIQLSSATQQFSAQVNGPTLTPVATATSGDPVVITSSTPQYCTVSGGVVSFVGATPSGQSCQITYYDAALATNPNSTYESATLTQSLAVAKGENTITVTSSAPTGALYGGTYTPVATATSGDTVVVTTSPSSVCRWDSSTGIVHFVGVGLCTVSYADPGNANYVAASPQTQTFAVAQAPLTVTVQPATSTYGSAPPPFHVTYSGFQNGDGPSVISGAPIFSTSVTSTTSVGTYPLTASLGTLNATNYYFSPFVASTVTVQPAPLTVAASSPVSTYGSTPVAPTYTISGEVNGDTPAQAYNYGTGQPTLTDTVTSSTGVGIYGVTVTQGSLVASPNYQFYFLDGSYTVQPAVLTVTAGSPSMVYGDRVPTLTYAVSGFVNGDQASVVTGTPLLTTTANSTSSVGPYPTTATVGSLSAQNYSFQFAPGTLTVTQRPLTVSATGTSIYGSTPVAPTLTFSGFVNGDTSSVVSGAPSLSDAVTSSSPAASNYPITVGLGSLSATNYRLVAQNGTYTVSPATLYVTATNQTTPFGQPVPTLTYTVSGEVNGDSPAQAYSGVPSLSTTTATRPNAGQYPITVAAGTLVTSPNYTAQYVNGTLTVQKALLTVTANSLSMNYGANVPTLTYSVSGFVSPDTSAVITGTPTLQTSATSASGVGSYSITVDTSTMSATNYNFVGVNGLLTVGQDGSTTTVSNMGPSGLVVGHEDLGLFVVTVTTGGGAPAPSDQATVTLSENGQTATCQTQSTGGWLHVGTTNSYTELCSVGASALPLSSGTATVSLSASFPGDSNVAPSSGTGTSFTLFAQNPDQNSLTLTFNRRNNTSGTFSGSASSLDQGRTITLYYCTSTSFSSCQSFTSLTQPTGGTWSLPYNFSNVAPKSGTFYYFYATEPDYYLGTGTISSPMTGHVKT
jgi:prepilin-type N-terminal cleavage/methylation domain-containing protein